MGRFEKGHPGGPGRPKRQTESEYLAVTMAACPLDTWKKIVESAVVSAKRGDSAARTWLGRYLMGEPSAKAMTPTQVITQQLLGKDDPVFDDAVHLIACNFELEGLGVSEDALRRARQILTELNPTPP